MASDPLALASMLDLIVLSAVQTLRASGGAVATLDDGVSLTVRASVGLDARTLRALHPHRDAQVIGGLGRVGQLIAIDAADEDDGPGDDGEGGPSGDGAPGPAAGSVGGSERRSPARRPAGGPRAEQLLALPLNDAAERLVGTIYVVRHPSAAAFADADLRLLDVFARQAGIAIEQARLAAATLAEKNRLESMQSSFISIVSHELQTPVSIIKAYAGTLAREDAPWGRETVIRVARTIEEECDRLHALITELLDISRIQAGRVAMSIGPVDLADMAESLAERSRTRSPAHEIRTEFPPDFPIIQGDREKLRQALGNLVDNAIKYSPAGGAIVIGGRAERDHVVVSVRDEGIGIPGEERERVFERFHRVDTRLSRSTQGVGLGLYITKTIVDAHGGRIWVESPGEGHGSTFYIRLPR
jgi:signal transduction histidine kinase